MMVEKFHRTRELIQKIVCDFPDVPCFALDCVDEKIIVYYYGLEKRREHQSSVLRKGKLLPRYTALNDAILKRQIQLYLGKEVRVTLKRVTKKQFEQMDIQSVRARRRRRKKE